MKILLTLLLLSPLAFTEDDLIFHDSGMVTYGESILFDTLQTGRSAPVYVYCIAGYVFVRVGGETSLTQIMMESPKQLGISHSKPMTCKQYTERSKVGSS